MNITKLIRNADKIHEVLTELSDGSKWLRARSVKYTFLLVLLKEFGGNWCRKQHCWNLRYCCR